MNILIVDDSMTTRKVIRRSLVQAGIQEASIGEAGDGVVALAILQVQAVPMLVLCDVNMPNMSGEELLAKVGELEVRHTFVMVTSMATAKRKIELAELGAARVLAKPFDPAALGDLIAPYLAGGAPAVASPADSEASPDQLPASAALATLGLAALQSVLEQMAFTEVMPLNYDPPPTLLFGASLRLEAGDQRWIVRLATGSATAAELSNRITGQDPGEDEGTRLDAMRELANMVGGELVNRASARFKDATLSLPTSGTVRPGTLSHLAMRGVRLVPGDHHMWLHVEELA